MCRFFRAMWVAMVVITAGGAATTIEAAEPKPIAEFANTRTRPVHVEFSPDGRFLVVVDSGSAGGERGLLNIFSTGSCDDDGFGFGLLSSGGSIQIWNVERGDPEPAIRLPYVKFVFSADGKLLATVDTSSVGSRSRADNLLWDLTKNPPAKRRLTSEPAKGPKGGVTIQSDDLLVFSPDGKWPATGRSGVRLWRSDQTGDPVNLFDTSIECHDLFFDRKGERLAVVRSEASARSTDETYPVQLGLFELTEPQKFKKLAEGSYQVLAASFSADESAFEFLTVHFNFKKNYDITCARRSIDLTTLGEATLKSATVTFSLDAKDPEFPPDLQPKPKPEPTGLRKDGVRLKAATEGNKVRLSNTADGRAVGDFQADADNIAGHAWSRDGKRLATAGSKIRVWDVDSLPIRAEPPAKAPKPR